MNININYFNFITKLVVKNDNRSSVNSVYIDVVDDKNLNIAATDAARLIVVKTANYNEVSKSFCVSITDFKKFAITTKTEALFNLKELEGRKKDTAYVEYLKAVPIFTNPVTSMIYHYKTNSIEIKKLMKINASYIESLKILKQDLSFQQENIDFHTVMKHETKDLVILIMQMK